MDVQSKALRHESNWEQVGEHWDRLSNTHQHSCEQHTLLVCSFHQRWLTTWVREKNRRHTESLSPWSVKVESKKYLQRRRTEWQAKLSRKWNTRILPQSIAHVVFQSKPSKGKKCKFKYPCVSSSSHPPHHIRHITAPAQYMTAQALGGSNQLTWQSLPSTPQTTITLPANINVGSFPTYEIALTSDITELDSISTNQILATTVKAQSVTIDYSSTNALYVLPISKPKNTNQYMTMTSLSNPQLSWQNLPIATAIYSGNSNHITVTPSANNYSLDLAQPLIF